MMRAKHIFFFILLICLAGCAGARAKKSVKSLKEQLSEVSGKFESAKKENLDLQNEIALCKKYQAIDTQRFVKALDIFTKSLADDIAKDEAWLALTDRGLVITVSAEKLFATGTDTIADAGKEFLDKVAGLIEENFPYNYIYIEGHTDNQSLAIFEWKSDWDFSFARALSVLKFFSEKRRMDPLRLSASGFGQYRPRVSNDTKEGRRLNRRIVIIISSQKLKQSAA